MAPELKIQSLSKQIAGRVLYSELTHSFKVGPYAIIGPNGVGKTILLEMIAGVRNFDEGSITLNNKYSPDSLSYKNKLAYVPCNTQFFSLATGSEFISFILQIKDNAMANSKDLESIVSDLNLTQVMTLPFKKMSLGTQKKLFMTTITIGMNDLIVLDEPTNGIDQDAFGVISSYIKKLVQNSIVIIATHDQKLLREIQPTVIRLNQSPVTKFKEVVPI